jgi:aryl-phospho-beta-D-glucosidase BglC (GH1 family)
MKKIIAVIILIAIVCASFFIVNKIYAIEKTIKDIKYYDNLIENQKVATILLEKNTDSRTSTKEEVMKFDEKIEDIKDSNKKELQDTDIVKTGDYITINDEDYQVILYGDVNKDGYICDIDDIMIVQNNCLGKREVDDIEKVAGNLQNTDDILDIEDIMKMINIYLGISRKEVITQTPTGYIEFNNQENNGENQEEEEVKNPENNNDVTPVSLHGKLSVNGTNIVDKNGENFQLKGVSTHGIQWFPQYVNQEAFTYMRDEWGVNAIRLAMYSDTNAGYSTQLHELVSNGVEYAKNAGIYVIIDWHILSDGNPNTNKSSAIEFFKEMATKYKDYDNVLYEICNEPNGDVQWERDIKPYAQEVIKEIRNIDTDAIIIVGTPTWSQDVDVVAQSPITGYDNIMYTLHFYAATHKEYLRQKLTTALNSGLPVFVTEFGICDASGNGNVDIDEANKWIDFLNENNISWMCWNLSNKNESSALLKNTDKTTNWTEDELSEEGIWLLDALKR